MKTSIGIEYSSRRAFAESVYKVYGKKIYLLALGILKNNEEAEDCLQDVMKNVVSNVDTFISASENDLKSLLVKCTKNAAITIYRRVKRKREHEIPMPMSLDLHFSAGGAPDELVAKKEKSEKLDALIDDLSPPQREVIVMKYKMGMKNGDIAKVLGVPARIVTMRLYRAKKTLLEKKGDELNDII